MTVQTLLSVAINIASNRVTRQTHQFEAAVTRKMDEVAKISDPVAHGQALHDGLNLVANFNALKPLRDCLSAVDKLEGFKRQYQSDPTKPLVHQFYFGEQGDYPPVRDFKESIDTSKLTGVTAELVSALEMAGARLEWPPLINQYQTSFTIKVD